MSIKVGDIITASCGCIGVVAELPDKVYPQWLSKHGRYRLEKLKLRFSDPRPSTPEEIKEYKSHLFKAGLMYKSGEIVKFDNEF